MNSILEFSKKEILGLRLLMQFRSQQYEAYSELNVLSWQINSRKDLKLTEGEIGKIISILNSISKDNRYFNVESPLFQRDLVTLIANKSNLILDPDLDTFYLMYVLIERLPELIDLSKSYLSAKKNMGDAYFNQISKEIQRTLSEINITEFEDANFYGETSGIKDIQRVFKKTLTDFLETGLDLNNLEMKFRVMNLLKQTDDTWIILANKLEEMLKIRVSALNNKKIGVLSVLSILYLITLILVILFYTYVIRNKTEDSQTINLQQDALEKNAKFALLGELVGGVGHEIANPLAAIGGASGLLRTSLHKQGAPDNQKIGKYLDIIDGMVERIRLIIRIMRSQLREGEDLPIESINLKKVIDETLVLVANKMKKVDATCSIDTIDTSLMVLGTEIELSQVFSNILSNSFDALDGQKERNVKFSAIHIENEMLQIQIQDSGPGIPGEYRDRLFELLFTTKKHGTGLGLPISRKILNRLGGDIKIADVEKGACFHIKLRLA